MGVMEFLAMIFILLASLPMSSPLGSDSKYPSVASTHSTHSKASNQTSFVLPLFHREHPKVQSYFRRLKPLPVTPIKQIDRIVFYMEFLVGTPVQKVLAIFDTGSGFTWLRPPSDIPSTSYRSLSCKEYVCGDVPYNHCSELIERCLYQVQYADKTTSVGVAGIDKFHFYEPTETGFDPNSTIHFQVVFGTSDEGTTSNLTGVVGVSRQTLGVLTALQINQFSACFPKRPGQASSVRFGTYADLWGQTTPLVEPIWYLLFQVKSITIAGFQLTNLTIGLPGATFVFDTGSAVTYLHPYAWDNVVDRVKKYVPAPPMTDQCLPGFELCYNSKYRRSYLTLPFSFDLDGGASLQFSSANVWMGYTECECLAFRRSTTGRSIFGVAQMYGRNFGFDLDSKELFFVEDDCTLP